MILITKTTGLIRDNLSTMKQSGVILAALIGLLVLAAPAKADEPKTGDDELHRTEEQQGSADATELTTPASKEQIPQDNDINNHINNDMPNSDGTGLDQWQQQQQQQDAIPNMGDLFQFGRMPSLLPPLFDAPSGPGGFGGRHGPSGRLGGFGLSGGLFGRNGLFGSDQLSAFDSPLPFDPLSLGKSFHRTLNQVDQIHRDLAKQFEEIKKKTGETPVSKSEFTFSRNGAIYRKQVIISRLDPNQPMVPDNKQIDQQQELQEQQPAQQQEQQQQQEPTSPTVAKLS